MLCSVGLKAYSVFAAFLDNGFLHHGNEPLVCSMIESSQPPLTSWGKSKSEDTYRVFVKSPACWGYVKSEKTKYQHMKAKYEQMKAKYQHVKAKLQ